MLQLILEIICTSKPVGVCEWTGETNCVLTDDAVFTTHEDGSISAGLLVNPYSSRQTLLLKRIIENFMINYEHSWKCKEAGVGEAGQIKWTMICVHWT